MRTEFWGTHLLTGEKGDCLGNRTKVRRVFVRIIWVDSISGWNGQQVQNCLEVKVKMKSFLIYQLVYWRSLLRLELWDGEEMENGWKHDLGPMGCIRDEFVVHVCLNVNLGTSGLFCAISSSISALCMPGKSLCVKGSLHRPDSVAR